MDKQKRNEEIRAAFAAGASYSELHRQFGLSQGYIIRLCKDVQRTTRKKPGPRNPYDEVSVSQLHVRIGALVSRLFNQSSLADELDAFALKMGMTKYGIRRSFVGNYDFRLSQLVNMCKELNVELAKLVLSEEDYAALQRGRANVR